MRPARFTIPILFAVALGGCVRRVDEWCYDLQSDQALTVRVAVAALRGVGVNAGIIGPLLVCGRRMDPVLDELVLEAVRVQPEAVAKAEEFCRDPDEQSLQRRLAIAVLARPGAAEASALLRLCCLPGVVQRDVLLAALLDQAIGGHVPAPVDEPVAKALRRLVALIARPDRELPAEGDLELLVGLPDFLSKVALAIARNPVALVAMQRELGRLAAPARAQWIGPMVTSMVHAVARGEGSVPAAAAFLQAFSADAVPYLLPMLDPKCDVALTACTALIACGSAARQAIPALQELARSSPDRQVRTAAAGLAAQLAAGSAGGK